ncbi:MAG: hypothetical protein NTV01_17745, partial [Bacteroidia bacterium]|nr:hypothetical protein [Bacteroidia bacterium]
MNKRRVSNKVFLYFLMLMFLVVTVGCSKSDDTPAPPSAADSPVVGNATITGTVSGTTIVAIDETNAEVTRATATGIPKSFSITVPITSPTPHVYRFYLIENEGTLDQQIYPLYVGAINAFTIASVSTNLNPTINLGFVDTTTNVGVATPVNNPLSG